MPSRSQYVIAVLVAALFVAFAWGQSSRDPGAQQRTWTYTQFPIYGVAVTPADDTPLAFPMAIRVDADGQVTARCYGGGITGTAIVLNLVAGEFFPCQVISVEDTGTDAITIHGFY